MKLSFVIPAYNEELYVGRCLESIARERAGSTRDIEVIVVNNASTDNTARVAHMHPGVRVVSEPKKGLVAARHAGFLASTGELIANIDADTMLTPGWIEKVFHEFEAHPDLVALSGPHVYYDLPWTSRLFTALWYRVIFGLYIVLHYIFRVTGFLQGGNFIVRREALEKIGGFNTKLEFWGEDADVAVRLNAVGKVKFTLALPIFASGRRLAGDGMVSTALRYGLNYFWILFFQKPFFQSYNDFRPSQNSDGTLRRDHTPRHRLVAFLVLLIIVLGIPLSVYFLYSAAQVGFTQAFTIRQVKADSEKIEMKVSSFAHRMRNAAR